MDQLLPQSAIVRIVAVRVLETVELTCMGEVHIQGLKDAAESVRPYNGVSAPRKGANIDQTGYCLDGA
jgi:hypothetical protein